MALATLVLSALLTQGAYSGILRISNAAEFIKFANNRSYSGSTVYLDADVDFSGGFSDSFTPIFCFWGVFDGQGHKISNLHINSSFSDVGIFNYSNDATVKNLVLDSSCSVMNAFGQGFPTVGGIIGECSSSFKGCLVEGIVNMASVTLDGIVSGGVAVGGIVGIIRSSDYGSVIRNCANYGPVYCHGSNQGLNYIGGVVGGCLENRCHIQNCFNNGTIFHDADSTMPYVGGILGYSYHGASVNNSFSSGRITAMRTSTSIGSIIGELLWSSPTEITHCFWTSDVGFGAESKPNLTITESSVISFEASSINVLNSYVDGNNGWNRWEVLQLNGGKIKGFDQTEFVTVNRNLMRPEKEYHTLVGWEKSTTATPANDITFAANWALNNYTVTFDFSNGTKEDRIFSYGSTVLYPLVERDGYTFSWDRVVSTMPAEDITITGIWTPLDYIVTFDFGNGTKEDRVFSCDSYVVYPPSPERKGYSFSWDKEITTMPAENITITGIWTPLDYTVTFDFSNGTKEDRVFGHNATILYPSNPEKSGYIFSGWDRNDTFMPAENITIIASWTEIVSTEVVEIVFSKKDLKKEEVETIIKEYTEGSFVIERFETDEGTGEIKVIIRFSDDTTAEEFVRKVNEDEGEGKSYIREATIVKGSLALKLAVASLIFAIL